MAKDVTHIGFDVQPIENANGTLEGVTIQKASRTERVSTNGRTIDFGKREYIGEPMDVPIHKLAGLISELVDWSVYYATGTAAADRAKPVNWPNNQGA